MATAAKKAQGTKLYRGGSGTPRTGGQLIEEVFNIDLPEAVSPTTSATSHDSDAAEVIPASVVDHGEITVEMFYSAATGQELLRGDLGGAATGYYVNLAGGTGQKQLAFSALVTSFKPGAAMDGALTATAKLKVTGAITWNTQG